MKKVMLVVLLSCFVILTGCKTDKEKPKFPQNSIRFNGEKLEYYYVDYYNSSKDIIYSEGWRPIPVQKGTVRYAEGQLQRYDGKIWGQHQWACLNDQFVSAKEFRQYKCELGGHDWQFVSKWNAPKGWIGFIGESPPRGYFDNKYIFCCSKCGKEQTIAESDLSGMQRQSLKSLGLLK
jgi:hypothetical protein